jgi:acylphosphatase
MSDKKAIRFVVHGKVQGVGYRFFARTCAEALGITGWVRNREDGTVEAHAEGAPEQLEEFGFDLSRGARYARVSRVDRGAAEVEGHSEFVTRR